MKRPKLVLIIIVLVVVAALGAGVYFKLIPRLFQKPVATVVDQLFGWKFPITKFPLVGPDGQLAYSNIRDPGGIPQGLPVRLKVPVIGVDSAIEDALITPDGRMDVPIGSVNVAWFSLGPHPGDEGSAVIGGHFGIRDGVPFVFYNLDKLKVGDKVYVVDDKDQTLAFQVREIKLFDRNADATTVFTSDDGLAHLNLITCEGIWNQVDGSYPERRVVFTDAIPSEGAVTVTPKSPTAAIPTPNPTPTPTPTPTTENTVSTAALLQSVNRAIKSAASTPIDALITFTLLASIAYMATKIVRLRRA